MPTPFQVTPYKFSTEAAAIVDIERLQFELHEANSKAAPLHEQLGANLLKYGINLKAIGGVGNAGAAGGDSQPAMNATEICAAVNAGSMSKEHALALCLADARKGTGPLTKLPYAPLTLPSCT